METVGEKKGEKKLAVGLVMGEGMGVYRRRGEGVGGGDCGVCSLDLLHCSREHENDPFMALVFSIPDLSP